jgi:pyridoxamine 5'-phosphate oxidase
MNKMNLADLRTDYTKDGLIEADLYPDPFQQFGFWFDQALKAQVDEPNAMTLATSTLEGQPSARIVLLKGFDDHGFVFYTNYESRKGKELALNNKAALLFFWSSLERQVRIEGLIEKVSEQESKVYFDSRPEGSRIGAWSSHQSEPIGSRKDLEDQVTFYSQSFENQAIPRPPFWGGYRLKPQVIEFWQGRESRLHDRLRYRLIDGHWNIDRLSP